MAKCPICKKSEADKKNVHLIPWFMIKKSITSKGSGIRDMELSFTIDANSFTKIYKGRSILPEVLEEYGNRPELEKQKENPYSRDNLICRKCEENLSRLEAIFAFQFTTKKIRNAYRIKRLSIDDNHVLLETKFNYSLFELFIQSIFYRCSIGRFDGFKLHPKIEAKIEENLKEAFLINDFNKITASKEVSVLYSFPLIVSTSFIPEGEDPTKQFIELSNSRFPYCLIAGYWIIQMFEAEKHLKSTIEWNFGLKGALNPVDAYNITKGKAHVVLLTEITSQKILKNIIDYYSEKKINGIKRNIRQLHLHLFGKRPDTLISQYIFQHYFKHLEGGKTEFNSLVHAFLELKNL